MGSPPEGSDFRPFSLTPFGALVRVKGTKSTGPVTGYLIPSTGPIEYVVKTRSGRIFVPCHLAVPIRRTASREGIETRGASPKESR